MPTIAPSISRCAEADLEVRAWLANAPDQTRSRVYARFQLRQRHVSLISVVFYEATPAAPRVGVKNVTAGQRTTTLAA